MQEYFSREKISIFINGTGQLDIHIQKNKTSMLHYIKIHNTEDIKSKLKPKTVRLLEKHKG